MAGQYDHQGNGKIHSFSSCSKQKDYFAQRRVAQEFLSCPCPLVYTVVLSLTLIQLKIFASILPVFDPVLFFVGGYIHLSER